MKDQTETFEPLKRWIESKGFKALVTGGKSLEIVIPVKDLLPIKSYLIPDIVGIKGSDVVVIEVEMDPEKALEAIGKCMVLKTTALLVYLAYPKKRCPKLSILEKLGIGLLGVSGEAVEEVVKILPAESSGLFKVLELHPLDFQRQSELNQQIRRVLETRG